MAKFHELYYGEPFSGKSRSLCELIKRHHEKTGQIARVYVGDGSAAMYHGSGMVDAGVVQLVDFSIRDFPFTSCQQICEGFVPADASDPQSPMRKLTQDEVKKTGLWIYEGAAVMSQYMMGDKKGGLAQRAADGESLGGTDNVIKFEDSAENKFGGNNPTHYNLTQRHMAINMNRTKALPGEFTIWTTHERMDTGERGGQAFGKGQAPTEKIKLGDKCIGPEIVGQAMTPIISRDFGNTLHFVLASKKVAGKPDPITGKIAYEDVTDYRVYCKQHFDPNGTVALPYIAGNRAFNPEKMSTYYGGGKAGEALIKFYEDFRNAAK